MTRSHRTSADARCWPIGAELVSPSRTHFRVWAPRRQLVDLVIENGITVPMAAEPEGYFSCAADAGAGTRYRYRLDQDLVLSDPASRFQPEGPFGPSQVVNSTKFPWTDHDWPGVQPRGRVLYEMHIGTFTPEGTFRSALEQLPRLAEIGVNVLEVMPVADFPGRFGWGYDGVNLFAPTHLYGVPDDFRAFIDRAHALGIGVILDVVYNHLGPDGNYLKEFSHTYFSKRHKTDWGEAINFDDEGAGPVREYYLTNAAFWIDEYHLDGLRLDATQDIHDDSPGEHVLAAIARVTRAAAGRRSILLVAENEPQQTRLVRSPDRGGYGLDMLWNDDFHHTAKVALTGRTEAYYADYRGRPQELISAVKYGYLYQGQYYIWQEKLRGTPAFDVPPDAFVVFLDNHDQVANSGLGLRCQALTSPGRYRALTALLLLAPGTPMLFQGQEFAASAPFVFFADHRPELARLVRDGRRDFLKQFPSLEDPRHGPRMPDPHDPHTFQRCKLNLEEIKSHAWAVDLHRDLLRLRREHAAFRQQRPRGVDGAVLSSEALALRFFGERPEDDRLLLMNLGRDLHCVPMPEPLLAPPAETRWQILLSTEEPRYAGSGIPPLAFDAASVLPADTALVLGSARVEGAA